MWKNQTHRTPPSKHGCHCSALTARESSCRGRRLRGSEPVANCHRHLLPSHCDCSLYLRNLKFIYYTLTYLQKQNIQNRTVLLFKIHVGVKVMESPVLPDQSPERLLLTFLAVFFFLTIIGISLSKYCCFFILHVHCILTDFLLHWKRAQLIHRFHLPLSASPNMIMSLFWL